MLKLKSWMVVMALWGAAGCGTDGDSPGGTEAEAGSCDANAGASAAGLVALRVDTPLPSALLGDCSAGAIDALQIFMTIPGEPSCFLGVENARVVGCCPDVATNQSVWVDLFFRETAGGNALGGQGRQLDLPTTSDAQVMVDFSDVQFSSGDYDSDGDGVANVAEFCAGTL